MDGRMEFRGEVLREQVRLAMLQVPTALAASFVAALVFCYLVRNVVPYPNIIAWLLINLAIVLVRLIPYYRFRRVKDRQFAGEPWRRLYLTLVLASGIVWGASASSIFPAGHPLLIALLVVIVISIASTTTVIHSSIRFGPAAWVAPALLLYGIRCAMEGGEFGNTLSVLIILCLMVILYFSRTHHSSIAAAISLRFENLGLLEEMRKVNEALHQEIAERGLVEEKISKQTTLLSGLLDSIPDAVFFKDTAGVYLGCNPAFAESVGRPREEITGKTDYDLFDRESADSFCEHDRIILEQGAPHHSEEWIDEHGGKRILVDILRAPLRSSAGALIGLLGVSRDVTERRQAEEELRATKEIADAMNRELRGAIERANLLADQAASASVAKSEFLANMSHEIRTPMNGVIGMTDVLLDTELSTEQREYAEIIKKSGEALLGVINDILDFSKIEAGKLEVEQIDFELAPVLEDLIDVAAPRAFEKKLDLTCLVDPLVPSRIHSDPGRIRQILANLLGNSIKFTHEGEVALHVSLAHDDAGRLLRFTVTDTGIGIPEQKLGEIFQPFTQVDGSITRKYGGTGLGLSISKQLVEIMGGAIGAESEEGKGSMFWFTLPVGTEVVDGLEGSSSVAKPPLSDIRVLVMDGSSSSRRVFASIFDSWGCGHEELCDVDSAPTRLREVAAAGAPFDIFILDASLPETANGALAKMIGEDPLLRGTRLVTMTPIGKRGTTAWPRKENRDSSAFLTKPVKRTQLANCLLAVLGRLEGGSASLDGDSTRFDASGNGREKLRILLAEDNATNQKVALKILEKLGYEADVAATGVEALKAIEARRYDLVLMDMQMPEMDGLEAARRIRELGPASSNRNLPIIAMSAHAMRGYSDRCIEAGMNDYITKPVRPHELAEKITRWAGSDGASGPVPSLIKEEKEDKVFDSMSLLERLGGDRETMIDILATFLEDVPVHTGALETAIEESDLSRVRFHAHTLKGSAASFGANALRSAVALLEVDATEGNLNHAREGLERIRAEFARFKQAADLLSNSALTR
jgi:two-component system sensor histidine kinase/response regulator